MNSVQTIASPKVELRSVGLRYFGLEGETEALKDISISTLPGEFVAIIGQSGCGKSTLLSLISGILTPTQERFCLTASRSRERAGRSRTCSSRIICSNGGRFIAGFGGAVASSTVWLPVARAQQAALPVVAFINVTERPSAATPSSLADTLRDVLGHLVTSTARASRSQRHRIPTVGVFGFFVIAGGLMASGTDKAEMFRGAASYVDPILKGERPADIPVQQPTKFQLVINLRTAKTLGIEIPPRMLAIADEVIE
jgi:energy-coupling factor transporter ATP-binding protein EcfA2